MQLARVVEMPRPDAPVEPAEPSETELLAALENGDLDAGERLVERTYGLIFNGLLRMTGGDRDLAADLTQETYRRAWSSLRSFHRRSRFSTWVYRIAYNTFLNHRRSSGRMQPLPEAVEAQLRDPRRDAVDRVAAGEEREAVRRAVLELDDRERYTLTAHYWGELPVSEIAALEAVTPAAIRKRLSKATARLRTKLDEVSS